MRIVWKMSLAVLLVAVMGLGGLLGNVAPGIDHAFANTERVWGVVGNAGFSPGQSGPLDMKVDTDGTIYVAYINWSNSKATVMKYSGGSWSTVGNAGFTAGAASSLSLVVHQGTPYVAFVDGSLSNRATLMTFNGSSWTTVEGGAGFSAGATNFVSLFNDNGTLYVAYQDQTSSFVGRVMRYNGSGWDTIGGAGSSFSSAQANDISLYVYDGTVYVAYRDVTSGSKATVKKYNGSAWEAVGGTAFTPTQAVDITLSVADDVPYIAYENEQAYVMKYNGSSWEMVGGGPVWGGRARDISMVVDSGVPYVSFMEYPDTRIFVRQYTGSAWENAGSGDYTSGVGSRTAIDVHEGVPYVAFADGGASTRVTVRKLRDAVVYDGNGSTGGNVPATAGYDRNAAVTVSGNSGNLVRTGYTFSGWNTAADGNGTSYGAGATFTMGDASVRLYAQWTANSYTVSFNSNGGSPVSPQAVLYGNQASEPAAPEKTGHTFAGWYSDEQLNNPYSFAENIGAADVTLYAKWTVAKYTVTYNGNGATSGSAPSVTSHDYGTAVTVPGNPGGLVKTGHTFAGWNTSVDGSGTSYAESDTFTIGAANVTLYAKWTAISYTVTYDGNGATSGSAPSVTSHDYNTIVTVPGNPGGLVKTGHTFAGWNTSANGGGTNYAESDPFTMGAANVTLYAKWTANSYTISFDSNGGSAVSDQSVIYGNTATEPSDPVLTGYTFAGWYSDSGLTTAFAFSTPIGAADMRLYAKWTINSYTVTYDGNGATSGSAPSVTSHDYNTGFAVPGNPGDLAKTGHTFAGWMTAADGSGTDYAESEIFTIGAANVTLYAKWTANSYTISFDSNGGSAVSDQSVIYGNTATEPSDPVLTGYTFAGWYSDSGLTTAFAFSTPIGAADMTLYAKWTINSYTVTYDGNGATSGSVPSVTSHDYNTAVTVPGNPGDLAKTGHTFAGWMTAADGSGADYAESETFTIGAANVTLYAKWTANHYTVSFESNGGSAVSDQSVIYGNTATEPSDPALTGHTFAGWYADSGLTTAFAFSTPIGAADMRLYAKWTINSYTVTYDGNGATSGSAPSVTSHDYNTGFAVPGNPGDLVRTGYTLTSWNTEADGSGSDYAESDIFTIGAADVTLYAMWTVNSYTVSFESNGGSAVPDQSIEYGSTAAEPMAPTRTGYTFAGWFADSELTLTFDFSTTIGAEDVTLYSKWLSANALLSGLSVEQGTLSPSFAPADFNYNVDLDYVVTELSLAFEQADPTQTVTVTGAVYESVTGTLHNYEASNLVVGPNPILIDVTAEDGTENVYTIIVNRASGNNADLSGLTMSSGTLSPGYSSETTAYAANVANGVSSLTVTATASDPLAAITVNGQSVISGQPSGTINLTVGNNPIDIEVTAQDGTNKTYSITVNRASASGGIPSSIPVTSQDGKLTLPIGRAGEVSLDDAIVVSIPSGASGKQLELTIEKVSNTQSVMSNGEILSSPVYEVLINFTENFSKPVTLTMKFDPAKVKSGQTVAIFYYDEAKNLWVKVEGGKINGNRISAEVDHFTKFSVLVVDGKTGLAVTEATTGVPTDETVAAFSDIAGHWAEATIKQAAGAGIVGGYADGTFRPNRTVTRAEFAVMLVRALKLQGEGAELAFTDTEEIDAWARKAIAHAVQEGILNGYEDGTFRPNAEITRSEMAVMLANALELPIDADAATRFADEDRIPAWAKGAVEAIRSIGLVKGKGSGEFDPLGKTTRAEAATVLLNMWSIR